MFTRNTIGRWFCIVLLAFMAGKVQVQAQPISREYPLKAVFLMNFAQFTEWPANVFESPDSPFVIGVLGDDPFGGVLDETVRGENWNGRKFVVQRFRRVEEVQNCQMLFISQSEIKRLDKILTALKDRPILTVSEIENPAYSGIGVRFITENNKIHLRINTDSLKDANLNMSSKLLRVAELVHTQKP